MKHRYVSVLLIVLVCSCIYLFFVTYSEVKEKTIADFNSRQLILARQAGRGLEEYFSDLKTFLTKVSESGHVIVLDEQGKKEMDFALKTGRQGIKAITRVDATGRILYTLPYDAAAIGRDISYQKHIREIMNIRKPVISDVFTTVQGYNAVGLHVPVFKGNEYRGTLAFLIDFQSISKRFLEDIRIGETGYAWVTSRDGIELYCPVPGHTGKSVFENRKDFPSIISMANEMVKGHQGITTYTYDQIRDRKTETVMKYAVYLPVEIGNTFWSIVVASSADEDLASLEGFRNKLIVVIGLLLLGSAVFSFYGMRARGIIREEAKRQKTEEALRESEARYRDLVENATDLICTHDLKGTLLSVNAAAARDMGLAAEEVVGLSIPDLLPEARRHEFNDYIKAIQRDGTAAGTMKVMTRNGEVRFWEYRNTLRTEGVAEPVVRGMARDVTGEVLAKRALRKSEKRYRLLFERNLAGVYRTTIDGRLLDCNDAFARIYGYDSRDEVMQHDVVDFHVSPEAREKFIAELQAGRMLLDFESQKRRKDGSMIWLLENASLVPGEETGITEIEGMLIDITKRKRTERELRDTEEIFRQFMDNSPIYVFFKDENIRAIRLSRNFEKMVGRPIDELLGKTMYDLFPSDLANSMVEDDMRILKEGKQINIEEELNGRFYSTIKFPIYLEGKPRYLAGFTIDITERRRMEEELLKADKLESVGILAGGIAHDFNNMLTSIVGNISLARMHVKPGSREFDLLSSAETASMRARGLTGQLLTFAKGGALTKETASISNLIKETSLFMMRGSKSECEFLIAEDLWPVEADLGQIGQVFSNIVINANQAMPKGGIIQVKAENLVLDEKNEKPLKPGRYIRVSVKDHGAGIAEKHISKIFDPYFTTKSEGSGLGLATAYSIVKKHNGHISVNSRPGVGTTFDIYLPVSDKAVQVIEAAAPLKGQGKILLMDDESLLREMAKDMFEMLGYEADFAKDGVEAINMFREARKGGKPYDAVILDLTIPGGMGGMEAIKELLELDPKLKAIVCSGYSEGPVMSNYREYGFKVILPKPFDLNMFSKALKDVLKEPKIDDRTSNIESRRS